MKNNESLRRRIFTIIQIGNKEDIVSRGFDMFISAVILLNILATFLITFDELSNFFTLFRVTEIVTVSLFAAEYLLRLWTADLLYPDSSRLKAVGRFIISFDGIVDLLTILPFFFLDGFVMLRMLRVVRIFHLFRLNAQYDSFHIITKVIVTKKNQILSSLFIIVTLMFASSLCIYSAEHEAQPEAFKNAFSGIWWSMATLLTVGYGDINPITITGKIMAILTAFLGVGLVAIPTGIISAGFVEQYQKNEHSDARFPDIKEVGEILVKEGNELIGLNVRDITESYGVRIYVLIRGELTIVPLDNVVIQPNDILIVNTEKLVKANKRRKQRNNKAKGDA